MDRAFRIATIEGLTHQWKLWLSDRSGIEKFLSRSAAHSIVEDMGKEQRIQLLTYESDRLLESWFFEPGKAPRRLNVHLLGEANARDVPDQPPELVVMAIRPLGQQPCPWHVLRSDSVPVHDGCRSVGDAKDWIRNVALRYGDGPPVMLIVHNLDDRMDEAWSIRGGRWRQLPLKVRHPTPGEDPNLYPGNSHPRSKPKMTLQPAAPGRLGEVVRELKRKDNDTGNGGHHPGSI
jgi:hypothetical protein